jgi:preprotein translocase subunit SecG
MDIIFLVFQIVVAIALILLISIQGKGGGLGSAFGANYAAFSKRRGVEKMVFNSTILLVILFFVTSVLNLVF